MLFCVDEKIEEGYTANFIATSELFTISNGKTVQSIRRQTDVVVSKMDAAQPIFTFYSFFFFLAFTVHRRLPNQDLACTKVN